MGSIFVATLDEDDNFGDSVRRISPDHVLLSGTDLSVKAGRMS
ncbi:MAG: hypothetical protein P5702_23300 [Limnospira sp. PMC 1291.21]|uniref:Uncharacterized protein n=3 Tax=Limnospira TaxID=2596745 RepID=A0A9P1KAC4_9CYAN|nr:MULTISPECIES: hypothetical protein [Limnospira]EKD10243.1 hypothetical protein SPLC1_S102730 [Arthrospira platensis C1]MDC0837845.1 hypothetical protein [Limnoraphis robusta]MDT9200787.1 hypothetical protein [Limnospira sp. PMC 1042.18]MDY7051664.1 hypothetical protein [Limnospira fusiformis LS22]EDZ95990.1 hypothetical protein AmaxDRAFT_1385 [Limnospira maxima CS-328]